PSGPYDVELHIGDFSANDVCDTETFLVTVSQPRVAANPSDTEWTVVPPVAEDAVLASAMTDGVHVTPNPFRGQAQLTYTVTATSDVLLAVYDVLGREVAVLVDGRMDAGTHAATFEADGLAAGTYVYRLVAGTDVEVGRLTLAR
ncbi:MAG: T9SS type A sorting domain-containing protein, partial [Rubricoccaceae bacterium]|nr:T9SS type A sorting domain-containing protein [Rubricoccaceae bacterium]